MTNTTKLSSAQRKMLLEMLRNSRGESQVPTGYRTAGRDASNWHRTMDVLAREGLVESWSDARGAVYGWRRLTKKGRAVAQWLVEGGAARKSFDAVQA